MTAEPFDTVVAGIPTTGKLQWWTPLIVIAGTEVDFSPGVRDTLRITPRCQFMYRTQIAILGTRRAVQGEAYPE